MIQKITNVNGSAMVHLEAVKQVDNASKMMQAAVQRVSVQQQKLVESILQVVQTSVHDATQNHMRLDSKLADVILMRIASLLDTFKSNLTDPVKVNVDEAKKEILEKIEDLSEGFLSKLFKQYLAQQIVSLLSQPATKDDIEELKQYLGEIAIQQGEQTQKPGEQAEEESQEDAEKAELKEEKVSTASGYVGSSGSNFDKLQTKIGELVNGLQSFITQTVIPKMSSEPATVQRYQRYTNNAFNTITDKLKGADQYLRKNISPQFGLLKTVMLTAVLAPILSISKDILGTVGKIALITTGIILLTKFLQSGKGFFDYFSNPEGIFKDIKDGWVKVFDWVGDAGSALWDMFSGVFDWIWEKISKWLSPKIDKMVDDFFQKYIKPKIGDLTELPKMISGVLAAVKPLLAHFDGKKSLGEAILEWWESPENQKFRIGFFDSLVEGITSALGIDKKTLKQLTTSLKDFKMPDMSKIEPLLQEITPLVEEFNQFKKNAMMDDARLGESEVDSKTRIFDFILSKIGLDKDVVSKAVQNIANLDVNTINEKLKSLDLSSISGLLDGIDKDKLNSALDTFGKIDIPNLNKALEKVGKLDADAINATITEEIKKAIQEINPALKSLADKFTDKNGKARPIDEVIADSVSSAWNAFIRTSGLSNAFKKLESIAVEIGERSLSQYASDVFNNVINNNPGMKSLLGKGGVIEKLNSFLVYSPEAKKEESNENKPEDNSFLGKLKSGAKKVGDAVEKAAIQAIAESILSKIDKPLERHVLTPIKTHIDSSIGNKLETIVQFLTDIQNRLNNLNSKVNSSLNRFGEVQSGQQTQANASNAANGWWKTPEPPPPPQIQQKAEASADTVGGPVKSYVEQNNEGISEREQAQIEAAREAEREQRRRDEMQKATLKAAERAAERADAARQAAEEIQPSQTNVVVAPSSSNNSNEARQENYDIDYAYKGDGN